MKFPSRCHLILFFMLSLLLALHAPILAQSYKSEDTSDVHLRESIKIGDRTWILEQPKLWSKNQDVLILDKQGEFLFPFRRPTAIAVMDQEVSESFAYTAQVKCTNPISNSGRDVILVFGYQSPRQFYYAHLSNDNTIMAHNGIFIVDQADRRRIDLPGLADPPETRMNDQDWHSVKVVRDIKTGGISIYVDDLGTPLMQAMDDTFSSGKIGFGSFDNTGEIRAVHISSINK